MLSLGSALNWETNILPLKFAKKWNWDYDAHSVQRVNGKEFHFPEALALLKAAIQDNGGGGLRAEIDVGLARVVKGPHRTRDGDPRLHMTVHCTRAMRIYHIYMSANGNCSGVVDAGQPAHGAKTGHVHDADKAPYVPNSASPLLA